MNARGFLLPRPQAWYRQVERRDIADAFEFLYAMFYSTRDFTARHILALRHFVRHCGDLVDPQDYIVAMGWGFGARRNTSHHLARLTVAFSYVKRLVAIPEAGITEAIDLFMNRDDPTLRPYTGAVLALKRAGMLRPGHHAQIYAWVRAHRHARPGVMRAFIRDFRY